ncbi:MAG: M23 family metallopeptidase [Acidimicrobiia bacterium]|nr:M23 family metallopeptidase [Acidimicrobiia bacterium]
MRIRGALVLVAAAVVMALSACVPPDPLPPGTNPSPTMLCPVTGAISFSNDWHAPRGSSFHEGNDIFAGYGRKNVAAVSGTIDQRYGSRQGNAIWLHGDDGKLYFYAHLASWVGPDNRRVSRGEVIGYTGNTGDASGGAHHTHFEIRLDWNTPVNPYVALTKACG